MRTIRSRVLVRLAAVTAALAVGAAALAQSNAAVTLFKVVSAKDEIVVGLTADQLAGIQPPDAGGVATALKSKGAITVWRYSVGRGADGQLLNVPLAQVGLLAQDTIRVEPYVSTLATAAPQPR